MTRTFAREATAMMVGYICREHRTTGSSPPRLLFSCLILFLMMTRAVPQVTNIMTTAIERIGPDPDFKQKNLSDIDLSITTSTSIPGNTVVTAATFTTNSQQQTATQTTTSSIVNTTTLSAGVATNTTGTTTILTTTLPSGTTMTNNSTTTITTNNGTTKNSTGPDGATLTTSNPIATVTPIYNATTGLMNNSATLFTATASVITTTLSSGNQTESSSRFTTASTPNSSVAFTTISSISNSTGNSTSNPLPGITTSTWNTTGTIGTTTPSVGNTTRNMTLETTTPFWGSTTGNATFETTTPVWKNSTGNSTLEMTTPIWGNATGNGTIQTTTLSSWNATGNATLQTTTLLPWNTNTSGNGTLETTTTSSWNSTANATLFTTTISPWGNATRNETAQTTTPISWNATINSTVSTTTSLWQNNTGNGTVLTTTPIWQNNTKNETVITTTPFYQNTTGNETTQNSTLPWNGTGLNGTITTTINPPNWNATTTQSRDHNVTTVYWNSTTSQPYYNATTARPQQNTTGVTSTTPYWITNSSNDTAQWTTRLPSENYTTPINVVTNTTTNQTSGPGLTLTTAISATSLYSTTSPPLTTAQVTSSCANNSCSNNATCQPTSSSDVLTGEESARGYICRCSDGWTGANCTIVVRSCVPACSANGLCNTPLDSNLRPACLCYTGWTGSSCTSDIDECLSSGVGGTSSVCPAPNSVCTNTLGSYQCGCQQGFEGDGVTSCVENVLYPYGGPTGVRLTGSEFVDKGLYTIRVPSGFPYFGTIYRQLQVAANGYIKPGVPESTVQDLPVPSSSSNPTSRGKFLPNDTRIAPYFSDIDLSAGGDSSVFVNSHVFESTNGTNSSSPRDQSRVYTLLMSHLSKFVNNSELTPRFAYVITWLVVPPYPAKIYAGIEKATFQAILTTDGNESYAVFNYPSGQMNWRPTSDNRTIVIGVVSENGSIYGVKEQDNVYRPDLYTNAGTPGRFIFKLGDAADLKSPNLFQPCLDWNSSQVVMTQDRFQSDQPIPACPCTRSQAEADPRFINRTEDSCWTYRITSVSTSALYPVCCYDSRGAIVIGVGGSHLESSDDLSSGYADISKGGFRKCCYNNASPCDVYYKQRMVTGCSNYEPPKFAQVWGDPHLSTFDAFNYSFNGLGEYILYRSLNASGLLIQGRFEKISQVELNVTCLTSVVFTSSLDATDTKVELRVLEGSSAGSVQAYANGATYVVTPGGVSLGGIFFQRDGSASVVVVLRSTSTVLKVLPTSSSPMARCLRLVTAAPPTQTGPLKAEGPLVNAVGNDPNITEQEIYNRLVQWKITRSTESFFTYTNLIPPATFDTFYQPSMTFQPTYFAERLNNLTYIDSNGQNITALCSNMRFCVEDFLKTRNISSAVEINQGYLQTAEWRNVLSNKPPVFLDNLPTMLQLVEGDRIELLLNATDPEGDSVVITVDTNVPGNQYSFNSEGRFSWLPVYIQNASYYLRFSAVDSRRAAALYWPTIQLCSCASDGPKDEVRKRCLWGNSMGYSSVSDRFQKIPCLCRPGWSGERCSNQSDVATCSLCNGGSQCLISSQATPSSDRFYCGNCTAGLIRDGYKCYDDNECLRKPAPCNQLCRNQLGTFTCSCETGYTLLPSNNRTCVDIDECQQLPPAGSSSAAVCGSDGSVASYLGQYCQNTIGSYRCLCKTGFFNNSGNSASGSPTCVIAHRQYSGRLRFEGVITGQSTVQTWDKSMNISGSTLFEMVARNVESEVSKAFVSMNTSFVGTKVTQLSMGSIVSSFDLYFGPQTSMTAPGIAKLIVDYLDRANCQRTGASCNVGNLTFVDLTSLVVKEKDYCSNPVDNNCDSASTQCSNYNGGFLCRCRDGFQSWRDYESVCKDINECETDPYICPNNSTCINAPGSYICSCSPGYLNVSGTCTENLICNPNPCMNGGECTKSIDGYECRCSGIWSGKICNDENTEAQRLKKIAMGLGIGLGALCLLLFTALLALCICYVRGRRSYDCTSSDAQPMADGNYHNGGGANKANPRPNVNYYEPATMQLNERAEPEWAGPRERAGPERTRTSAPENHEMSERAPMYQHAYMNDGGPRGMENPAYTDSTAPLANPRSRNNRPASSGSSGVEYF